MAHTIATFIDIQRNAQRISATSNDMRRYQCPSIYSVKLYLCASAHKPTCPHARMPWSTQPISATFGDMSNDFQRRPTNCDDRFAGCLCSVQPIVYMLTFAHSTTPMDICRAHTVHTTGFSEFHQSPAIFSDIRRHRHHWYWLCAAVHMDNKGYISNIVECRWTLMKIAETS